eukprot:GILJ01005600.1.p1 GENE.GILJ01005600.1~~GILJ01005600.1.p1  ORF type:complete len:474 (-),score=63.68 GILJ01005600.1:155-1576(-)
MVTEMAKPFFIPSRPHHDSVSALSEASDLGRSHYSRLPTMPDADDDGHYHRANSSIRQRAMSAIGHDAYVSSRSLTRSSLTLPRIETSRVLPGGIFSEKRGEKTVPLQDVAFEQSNGPLYITCYDYNAEQLDTVTVRKIEELQEIKPWATVRWINVEGLHAPTVSCLGKLYNIHPLAVEDIIDVPERVKIDYYEEDNAVFIATRMITLDRDAARKDLMTHYNSEQVSIFLTQNTLLTFQEGKPGDVWNPVRRALARPMSRVRSNDASYLLYALLDAMTDGGYPVVQELGANLEDIELQMLDEPTDALNRKVYQLKRELLLLRRVMWPMQDVMRKLISLDSAPDRRDSDEERGKSSEKTLVSAYTRTYMNDVLDHLLHLVDTIDIYREMSNSLSSLYSDRLSHKMNSVMYVLTIVSSIFIPLTFVSGIYGMNFEYMPEIHWEYGYVYIWCVFIFILSLIMTCFWKKGFFALSPA